MVERQAGALVVMPDPFFFARREQLVALAARYAVPAIYPFREFAEWWPDELWRHPPRIYISSRDLHREKFSRAPNRPISRDAEQ